MLPVGIRTESEDMYDHESLARACLGRTGTMTFEDVAMPEPGAGEVRIRNHAAGLNFFDILQVQGKYQIKPPFPFTPGAEVAGVVDAVGAGRVRVSRPETACFRSRMAARWRNIRLAGRA